MTTARWSTLSSKVGMPSGRVSVAEPALGMWTRRTGGAPVRAGLGSVQQRLEVALQVRFVVLAGLSVHAHRPVLAGPVDRPRGASRCR